MADNKKTKFITILVAVIFMIVVGIDLYINKQDEHILKIKLDVVKNFNLRKDRIIELNNAYREAFIDYTKLTNSNNILGENMNMLEKKYPDLKTIKDANKVIVEQNKYIEKIKKYNSIVFNNLKSAREISLKFFSHIDIKNKEEVKILYLSKKITNVFYNIRANRKKTFKKVRTNLALMNEIIFINEKLDDFKYKMIKHSLTVLSRNIKLRENLTKFYILEDELNEKYHKVITNFNKKHLELEKVNKINKSIIFILFLIFLYQIYKLLKIQKIINNKKQELQNLVNKHIIISTTDLKGIITSASEAFCKISGYTMYELVGKPHSIVRHIDMPNSAFKDMWDTIQNGKVWKGNVKNLKKDGGFYWVYAVIEPIFDSYGNINSYIAIRVEITDKIKLDELIKTQEDKITQAVSIAHKEKLKALEALKAKADFLANMSHEIRTPLNGILGFVDILKENTKENKENQEYLHIIDNSSQHLLGIINDILDFSKIESGKMDIDNTNFNIFSEFGSTIDLFKAKASEKNIYLDVNFDKSLPAFIISDSLRIKQIISNLLSNAIKFTHDDKHIYIDLSFKGDFLTIFVKDEGVGISEKNQEHIFDPFLQEDSTTTRKYGGTGLGLSICTKLVELMNGKITLESEVNVGSKFTFTIPIKIGNEIKVDEVKIKTASFNGLKLLLVEDNVSNVMFMKVILKKLGFVFDIAYDGIEAIEAFKNNQYDFILMDENMPNMGGIEAMQAMRKMELSRKLKHTIIIALTANALKGDRERFMDAGMDEYLTKPLKRQKLEEVLSLFV